MSNTTFCSLTPSNGTHACYVSFGRTMGYMSTLGGWINVHGAGAQRSDPKTGNPADYPTGFGPQGDAIRIYNYVRLVRNAASATGIHETENKYQLRIYPNPATNFIAIENNRTIENISIFTINGVMVANKSVQAGSLEINTSHLSNGIYIVSITDDLRQRHIEKIIINNK